MSEFDRKGIEKWLREHDGDWQTGEITHLKACLAEIDRLRAENERMRAVVEATQKMRAWKGQAHGLHEDVLFNAVDAYNAGAGVR